MGASVLMRVRRTERSSSHRRGVGPRQVLRTTSDRVSELGLLDPAVSDDALLDAMVEHPILVNRPIVKTPKGTKLCRPVETLLGLLPG